MLRCPALQCGTTAEDTRALSIHEATCTHRLDSIADALKKRALEDIEEERARKRARREERVINQQVPEVYILSFAYYTYP